MNHRQTYNNRSVDDNSKLKKTIKKNPVEQVFSTLPQFAISSALLFFAIFTHESPLQGGQGLVFYMSLLSSMVVCGVFFVLQFKGTEFKNWEKDAATRRYIQIASVGSILSFIGFNTSLWGVYGILTPIVIIAAFINVLSVCTILVAFITK